MGGCLAEGRSVSGNSIIERASADYQLDDTICRRVLWLGPSRGEKKVFA